MILYGTMQLAVLAGQLRELNSLLGTSIQFFAADDIKNQK